MSLFSNGRFTMAALLTAVSIFVTSYFEPILSDRLKKFDLTKVEIGWFFLIFATTYIPASVGVQFIPKQMQRRLIMFISVIACAVALIFVGPS